MYMTNPDKYGSGFFRRQSSKASEPRGPDFAPFLTNQWIKKISIEISERQYPEKIQDGTIASFLRNHESLWFTLFGINGMHGTLRVLLETRIQEIKSHLDRLEINNPILLQYLTFVLIERAYPVFKNKMQVPLEIQVKRDFDLEWLCMISGSDSYPFEMVKIPLRTCKEPSVSINPSFKLIDNALLRQFEPVLARNAFYGLTNEHAFYEIRELDIHTLEEAQVLLQLQRLNGSFFLVDIVKLTFDSSQAVKIARGLKNRFVRILIPYLRGTQYEDLRGEDAQAYEAVRKGQLMHLLWREENSPELHPPDDDSVEGYRVAAEKLKAQRTRSS